MKLRYCVQSRNQGMTLFNKNIVHINTTLRPPNKYFCTTEYFFQCAEIEVNLYITCIVTYTFSWKLC